MRNAEAMMIPKLRRWMWTICMCCVLSAEEATTTTSNAVSVGVVTKIAGEWFNETENSKLKRGDAVRRGAVISARAGQNRCHIQIALKGGGAPLHSVCSSGLAIRFTVPGVRRAPGLLEHIKEVYKRLFGPEASSKGNMSAEVTAVQIVPND
jgi:hypothetical protein